jgi:hypothetical protein
MITVTKKTASSPRTATKAPTKKAPVTAAKDVPAKPPITKKVAAKAATRSPRHVIDDIRVQADLAGMEGRDRLSTLVKDIETGRQRVEQAINALLEGSGDATRAMADGTREALGDMRKAIALAIRSLR